MVILNSAAAFLTHTSRIRPCCIVLLFDAQSLRVDKFSEARLSSTEC